MKQPYYVLKGGEWHEHGKPTEIIDLTNPETKCNFSPEHFNYQNNFKYLVKFLQHELINDYEKEDHIKLQIMERRKFSASVAIDETTLWITGGYNAFNNKKSTEFVSLNKSPLKGPDLPFTIWVRFEIAMIFFPNFFSIFEDFF